MAESKTTSIRLRPVTIAYLDDLADTGIYGKGRSGVMRRFIENGIARAVERNVIGVKSAAEFGETPDDVDEEEEA